jgi:transposase
MAKIRQKVSGCMRTLTGLAEFAALRSYTATTAKARPTHGGLFRTVGGALAE